jgi:hypothetical protein
MANTCLATNSSNAVISNRLSAISSARRAGTTITPGHSLPHRQTGDVLCTTAKARPTMAAWGLGRVKTPTFRDRVLANARRTVHHKPVVLLKDGPAFQCDWLKEGPNAIKQVWRHACESPILNHGQGSTHYIC